MAQINLLKTNTSNSVLEFISPKIVIEILAVILVGLLGYYGYLYSQSKNLDTQISKVQSDLQTEQNNSMNAPGREELFVRQQQLNNLNSLVSQHLYWSQFFEPLAHVTLKTAKYTVIKASSDGKTTLNIIVPSLADMDKYLQVFNLKDFNDNFSNLRVGGYSKAEGASSTPSYQMVVQMDFNPSILNYKGPQN